MEAAKRSLANLLALATSSWARRRTFSASALARSQASWCSAAFCSAMRSISSRLGITSVFSSLALAVLSFALAASGV